MENLKVHLMVEKAKWFLGLTGGDAGPRLNQSMLDHACEIDASAREYQDARQQAQTWFRREMPDFQPITDPAKAPDTLRPEACEQKEG